VLAKLLVLFAGLKKEQNVGQYTKPSYRTRNNLAHRILYLIYRGTSPDSPEWRDQTIEFFYNLFAITELNPGINVIVHRSDGLEIYTGSKPIVYIHFRQKHFLLHAKPNYRLWTAGSGLFSVAHCGSWPRMWKLSTKSEVLKLLSFIKHEPHRSLVSRTSNSRTIPMWVKYFVYERDESKCVKCSSSSDLCFDHIIPFSRGGASNHPDNIQLLCSKCNLEKSASFKY
jgi:hypothetical protein